MRDTIDAIVAEAKTGRGTRRVPYDTLLELASIALRHRYVLRTVHGFEVDSDGRTMMRSDASFHSPRSDALPNWDNTVRRAVDFAHLALNDVPDKDKLIYEVWFDASGSI